MLPGMHVSQCAATGVAPLSYIRLMRQLMSRLCAPYPELYNTIDTADACA